jgi:putative transposase
MANQQLTEQIRVIYTQAKGRYGSPRIHAKLQAQLAAEGQGLRCNRKRVARLMREAGVVATRTKRRRCTTQRAPEALAAPNLLRQEFHVSAPNQCWLGDITAVPTGEQWLYVAAVLDLWSRKIVGWAMDTTMETSLVLRALAMAVQARQPADGLLYHSDQGSQYTSAAYQAALVGYGITASMSGVGNCYDNAPMESFFATLKTELVHHQRYATVREAKRDIFEYIEGFYNRERLHSSLDYRSPTTFEQANEA